MSVNKYQMFLKTVECGSFSKAAEEMNFTQSAVSHAVQALENELGVTLLSRNRGGVVLTADGRLLLPRIEKLCAAHHELMRSAAELKGMDAGYVRVATFSSVSAQWLPSILKSFGERYPNIEFEVLTGDYYGQSEDWILQGKVDCGFLRLPSLPRRWPRSRLSGWRRDRTTRSRRHWTKWASAPTSSTPSGRIAPCWPWYPRGWASACCRS